MSGITINETSGVGGTGKLALTHIYKRDENGEPTHLAYAPGDPIRAEDLDTDLIGDAPLADATLDGHALEQAILDAAAENEDAPMKPNEYPEQLGQRRAATIDGATVVPLTQQVRGSTADRAPQRATANVGKAEKPDGPEREIREGEVKDKSVRGPKEGDKPDATDAAIERAAEHDIDLSGVEGTGKDGRITADDVDAAVAAKDNEAGGAGE